MSVSQVAPDVFVTVARTGVLVRGHAGGLRVHTTITEPQSLAPASLGRAEITKSRPSSPSLRILFLLVFPHIFHLSRLVYFVVHLDKKP